MRSSEEGYEEKITNFIYDRQHVILETDSQNNVKTRYIRGLAYISSLDNENNSNYYFYNGHGDVVQTINEAGEVQNRYDYDIFGNPTLTVEVYSNNIRYAGEYLDKETGLYYLRARYYNPYIGRFISEDSYWGEDSNTLSLNLYTYAHNNPIRFIDPSGHSIEDVQDLMASSDMSDSYRQVLIDGFIKKIDSLKKTVVEVELNNIDTSRYKAGKAKVNQLMESLALLETGNETVKKLVEQKGNDAGTWETYKRDRKATKLVRKVYDGGKITPYEVYEFMQLTAMVDLAYEKGRNIIKSIDAKDIEDQIRKELGFGIRISKNNDIEFTDKNVTWKYVGQDVYKATQNLTNIGRMRAKL